MNTTKAGENPQTEPDKTKELDKAKKLITDHEKTIEDYTNHLKRLQADFENYMKRTQKEQKNIADAAINNVIAKMLAIVDDFQHTLIHMKNEQTTKEEIINGVQMIFNKLHKFLAEEGVKPIESNGKKFDPQYHEVLLTEETNNAPENTILEELQKGYTRKDNVIRYAKVKIAKNKTQNKTQQEEKNG
ncbi:MAG: nucleotide exchange factor GrpE [Candidatus Aenigmarchaeota archaeon]|nr:nucleotide exchange factor GrpE [Candidatus Aenigmarchaeota archaeon]